MSSHHKTARELHDEREDHRNEASQRLRDATRLIEAREEIGRLRQALDEIVDDLSVPYSPAPWAAHALQVAQMALGT